MVVEERRYEGIDETSLPESPELGDEQPQPGQSSQLEEQMAVSGTFGSSFAGTEEDPYAWASRLRDVPDKAHVHSYLWLQRKAAVTPGKEC